MLKFVLALVFLLVGSMAYALVRKVRYGGPMIEQNGGPRSLREFAERRRQDREAAQQERVGVQ